MRHNNVIMMIKVFNLLPSNMIFLAVIASNSKIFITKVFFISSKINSRKYDFINSGVHVMLMDGGNSY